MSRARPPAHCAVCGAAIPPRAAACPECGADERTGWAGSDIYDDLDLPGEEFDHAKFVAEELEGRPAQTGPGRGWRIVAAVLLLVVGVLVLRNLFWVAP